MDIQRYYQGLPFTWQTKSPETIRNDCRWLESIILNAAPFSDWWLKARIIQMAYPMPPGATPAADSLPTYAGLKSEAEIVNALRSICDLKQYPSLAAAVDETYVIRTLNSWKTKTFAQAIGRNFEVYADRLHDNVFLVTSTATISLRVNRLLPPLVRYRPLFNIEELAQIMQERSCERLTLRTHGYANAAHGFYKSFMSEADALNRPSDQTAGRGIYEASTPNNLGNKHFYIGYHWPSEQPFVSPGLWTDFRYNLRIVFKFLFVLAILAGTVGTVIYALLKLLVIPLIRVLGLVPAIAQFEAWRNFSTTFEATVSWYWIAPSVFLLWVLFMQVLRVIAYQRDRYRAIHYGAPDLAEFFWRLDKAMSKQKAAAQQKSGEAQPQENTNLTADPSLSSQKAENSNTPSRQLLMVNLIGHSMGGLLLVNVLRILSDRFGKDDQGSLTPDLVPVQIELKKELRPQFNPVSDADKIGDNLQLDKLILASPDIPVEFLCEGRNNYVRSAMRRCRQIYLMSSDRDIVLRYLSTLGNWFSEPSLEMSGFRLGNVYLEMTRVSKAESRYRPFIRNMFRSQPAIEPSSAFDLFQKFNYIDCSEMVKVNGINLPLNYATGLLIDIINTLLHIVGHVDTHGGYFETKTPSFKILKLLMTLDDCSDENIWAGINHIIVDTPLRFLPSQPFTSPQPADLKIKK
ncbi:alpha/beta hydrolase [Microcoleus sp. FACHB-672]|uniref:alpha/beta hydrolase n=1 Tax=Microcoleus sp. FACHB-672 TaxID=2692825 RepID=UPI0016890A6B|nr:alpha/beta hydrolase [Microcoleus sp. FACHB-672]MBD2041829.1 alpha/beta hydrolase [Microcoleus sp. FACHB-672]